MTPDAANDIALKHRRTMDARRAATATDGRCLWTTPAARLLVAFLALLATASPIHGQYVEGEQAFYPDDPVWQDPDHIDGPVPEPLDHAQYYDLLLHSLGDPSDYRGPALNANTLGEVPNSSWYTNRHYRHPMSIEELQRGPNTVKGPSLEEPLRVVAGKQGGATLGVQVEDARGDRYLLKFDPPDYPEMSTAAEAITSKLFYALGYHVPENYVVYFTRDELVPGDSVTYEAPSGDERLLTSAFIDTLLAYAHRYPDGRYRALASRFVEGQPIGPFSYFGTRPDDPNDLYPHEARRELRGLRVFAAWVNHFDARMANTLDVATTRGDRTFLLHYLIDFGSTFGSGATSLPPRWIGHEYVFELRPILLRALTLGLGASSWIDIDYPDHPSLGRWEAQHFDPEAWKPLYPNPAFTRADAADSFWAARQVMHFTDDELRAIVATGRYSNPEAEGYVADVLIRRRDAIGEAYLSHGGGLDRFRTNSDTLYFEDLLTRYDLADGPPARTVSWHPFDNVESRVGPPFAEAPVDGTLLLVPGSGEPYLVAAIETASLGTTRVYLRRTPDGYEVVGLERSAH